MLAHRPVKHTAASMDAGAHPQSESSEGQHLAIQAWATLQIRDRIGDSRRLAGYIPPGPCVLGRTRYCGTEGTCAFKAAAAPQRAELAHDRRKHFARCDGIACARNVRAAGGGACNANLGGCDGLSAFTYDDTNEEVQSEERSREHPQNREDARAREVVALGRMTWCGGVHRSKHQRVPSIARRHDVEQEHGATKVIK